MKLHNTIANAVIGLSAVMLTACAVGPDYVRPHVNIPKHFKEAQGKKVMGAAKSKQWKVAEPKDHCYCGEWWQVFHDSTLNSLETRLNQSNQTLKNAYQNYKQARALVDEARSALLPTFAGLLNFTRRKNGGSSTTLLPGGVVSGGTGSSVSNNYIWSMNASWEPDIWGAVRRNIEAFNAGAESSLALFAATRLSMQASLAQYYFELRGLDRDQQLLDDTVKEYKRSLNYTQNRYQSGVAAQLDVVQARSQLETAEATALNNGVLRAQYEHAIAVLVDTPPATFSLPFMPLSATPPPIPLEVPSALLERRPDIAQAERLMAQANAQIGVAVAAYYPVITLSGNVNVITNSLFSLPSAIWGLSNELAETLFDGGLRNATVNAAQAAYFANVANYRQVVLTAFQDVEDNLVALRIFAKEAIIQKQAATDATLALKLITNQYLSGTVGYTDVITAQTTAYTANKTLDDLNYLRMTTAVGLIRALGGGWDVSNIQCPHWT